MRKSRVPTIAALLLIAVSDAGAGVTKGRPLETGQTKSFGPGSDGDLRPGLTRLFTDLGNGVVKDRRTGLSWEKKSDDGSIHDKDNIYSWSINVPLVSQYFAGSVVSDLLANLNTPPCFGGFCDWRLPTLTELMTLQNLGAELPSAFPEFDDNCVLGCTVLTCSCTEWAQPSGGPYVYDPLYWSSSTCKSDESYAWAGYFSVGGVGQMVKTFAGHARAVRGGF